MSRGQSADGIALMESAVGMAPKDPQTQYNVAVGLQSVGRSSKAGSAWERPAPGPGRTETILAPRVTTNSNSSAASSGSSIGM